MFCPKCGQWNAGSATQCTACGASLLPPGVGNTPAPTTSAAPEPNVTSQPPQPQMSPPGAQPSLYGSAPPAYPTPAPQQPAYPASAPQQPASPNYPQQNAPGSQSAPPAYPQASYPNYPQQPYPAQPQQQPYPNYSQQAYPNYPQQPNANAPAAPGNTPPAYPSYSPLPSYSPMTAGNPYAGAPAYGAYGAGYPAQMQRTLNQCKVCGSMLAYGVLACSVCLVPLGMIANPFDPTVTTYLDARALNQPGTSPVYAAPGAYAMRAANSANALPEEVKTGWNWGAALNSTLWAFTHRSAGWGLFCGAGVFFWIMCILGLSTVSRSDAASANLGMLVIGGIAAMFWLIKTLYLGSKGNEIAWRSGRFTNPSQMKNVQRQWTSWSIVVFFIASAVLIASSVIAGHH